MLDFLKSKLMILFIVIILGVTYIHSVNEIKMNEQNQDNSIQVNINNI